VLFSEAFPGLLFIRGKVDSAVHFQYKFVLSYEELNGVKPLRKLGGNAPQRDIYFPSTIATVE
jgi:hypothetical protein